MKIHKSVKETLGYKFKTSDNEIISSWKKRISELCKPCWELKYCPFGSLVEDFPIFPPTKKEAVNHNDYLKECINTGNVGSGEKLDSKRKKWFEKQINSFDENDYPENIQTEFLDASCKVFGHICPVFLVAEPLTETKERRKHSRLIPRDVMFKIVRRDGQICQKCNEPVSDNEVEFDHIIPYSKGGIANTENLRLIHKNCNRRKSNSLEEVLHPNPIEHLFELKAKKK